MYTTGRVALSGWYYSAYYLFSHPKCILPRPCFKPATITAPDEFFWLDHRLASIKFSLRPSTFNSNQNIISPPTPLPSTPLPPASPKTRKKMAWAAINRQQWPVLLTDLCQGLVNNTNFSFLSTVSVCFPSLSSSSPPPPPDLSTFFFFAHRGLSVATDQSNCWSWSFGTGLEEEWLDRLTVQTVAKAFRPSSVKTKKERIPVESHPIYQLRRKHIFVYCTCLDVLVRSAVPGR